LTEKIAVAQNFNSALEFSQNGGFFSPKFGILDETFKQ